jgi:hypothetical protein
MPSIPSFVIGQAIARGADADPETQRRAGLVSAFMPAPLLAAVVASGIVRSERGDVRLPALQLGRRQPARSRDIAEEVDYAIAARNFESAVREAAEKDDNLKRALAELKALFAAVDDATPADRREALDRLVVAVAAAVTDLVPTAAKVAQQKLNSEVEESPTGENGATETSRPSAKTKRQEAT